MAFRTVLTPDSPASYSEKLKDIEGNLKRARVAFNQLQTDGQITEAENYHLNYFPGCVQSIRKLKQAISEDKQNTSLLTAVDRVAASALRLEKEILLQLVGGKIIASQVKALCFNGSMALEQNSSMSLLEFIVGDNNYYLNAKTFINSSPSSTKMIYTSLKIQPQKDYYVTQVVQEMKMLEISNIPIPLSQQSLALPSSPDDKSPTSCFRPGFRSQLMS